jgi:hypothetical protein
MKPWLSVPVLLALILLVPASLQAYVDPNSAGPLFQTILPFLIGIASAWAVFRDKIRTAVRSLFHRFSRRDRE